MANFSPASETNPLKIKLSITWRGIQPGLKILSRYFQTGLGFSARPNGLKNPCNRYHFFHPGSKKEREHAHRLCFRTSVNLGFAPGLKFSIIATIFQPNGRGAKFQPGRKLTM